jgi:hypothetical protein
MPRVFVVQSHNRLDDNGKLTPRYDLTPAEEFGRLEFLLSPSASPFHASAGPNPELGVIGELRAKLSGYTRDDYLLLVGNPALIGFAVAVASQYDDGHVTLLQWDGKNRRYIPIKVNLAKSKYEDPDFATWRE